MHVRGVTAHSGQLHPELNFSSLPVDSVPPPCESGGPGLGREEYEGTRVEDSSSGLFVRTTVLTSIFVRKEEKDTVDSSDHPGSLMHLNPMSTRSGPFEKDGDAVRITSTKFYKISQRLRTSDLTHKKGEVTRIRDKNEVNRKEEQEFIYLEPKDSGTDNMGRTPVPSKIVNFYHYRKCPNRLPPYLNCPKVSEGSVAPG